MAKAIFNKMNAKTILCTFIILFFMHPRIMAQTEKKADYPESDLSLIFPAEHLAPATNNTGEVRLSLLKERGNTMITHFRFSPGSRNYWH